MPATLHGTTGNFGIADAETGMIVTDISYDYSAQEKTVVNHEGDIVGLAQYQGMAEIKISGLVATGGFSDKVGDALTIANTAPDHGLGTAGGITIITGISRSLTSEDFEKIEVTAKNYPDA